MKVTRLCNLISLRLCIEPADAEKVLVHHDCRHLRVTRPEEIHLLLKAIVDIQHFCAENLIMRSSCSVFRSTYSKWPPITTCPNYMALHRKGNYKCIDLSV